MIVSLSGGAKVAQSDMEGRYILQAPTNDDRDNYWIQENGNAIIGFNYEFGGWSIGYPEYVSIQSQDTNIFDPLLASTWIYYAADGNWNESKDIFVGPGRPGDLDLIDLNLVV